MKSNEKKKSKKWLWALIVIIAIILFALFSGRGKGDLLIVDTEVVTEDSVVSTVTATGTIQPVYKVTVGTKGSGIVERVHVDFNDKVRKGQLLAELDKSEVQAQLKTANAQKQAAQTSLEVAQNNYNRVQTLFDNKAATREEYDRALSELESAKSSMVSAKSNYENALTYLRYAEIYSPIDGIIINKNVEEGQTVQGSYSVPDLFTIAQNMTEIQVEAKVDETDIGRVKKGQAVTFTVDAYPDDTFRGEVEQIRIQPISSNNVITYTVIIKAINPDEKLFPGMTASVRIITDAGYGLCIPAYATKVEVDNSMRTLLENDGYQLEPLDNPAPASVWLKNGKVLRQAAVTTGAKDNIHCIATGINLGDTVVNDIVDPNEHHNTELF